MCDVTVYGYILRNNTQFTERRLRRSYIKLLDIGTNVRVYKYFQQQ